MDDKIADMNLRKEKKKQEEARLAELKKQEAIR